METLKELRNLIGARLGVVLTSIGVLVAGFWGFGLTQEYWRLGTLKTNLLREKTTEEPTRLGASKDAIRLKSSSDTLATVSDELARICREQGVTLTQVQTASEPQLAATHPTGTKDLWHVHAVFLLEGGPNSLVRVAREFSDISVPLQLKQFDIARKEVVSGVVKTSARVEIQAMVREGNGA